MPEESTTPDLVRLARQGYEALNRGDLDGVMSLFAADAVYDLSEAGLGIFEGKEAIRGFIEDWHRSWEEHRFEEEELLLVGGDGRVEQRLASLATWANGKIEWLKDYRDIDQARADAERLAAEGR